MAYKTEKMTDKVLVLGVDGFEPSLAKYFMDQDLMPALKKFIERGSSREDLVLLGAMPTVTPPQWTTLATGAYPRTHGIIQFFNPHPERLDASIYALDSHLCMAEPFWNVAAEAGKNTLVWHWPGSSWPPTSDSPNLTVVDGTQPGAINMGIGIVDKESMLLADIGVDAVRFKPAGAPGGDIAGIGCVITDLDIPDEDENKSLSGLEGISTAGLTSTRLCIYDSETEVEVMGGNAMNIINSPVKEPTAWETAPAGSKEFTLLTSKGFVRRPCLILQNEEGIYDRVAIYKSKKDTEPIIVIPKDTYVANYVDEIKAGEESIKANRCVRILELAEDGSRVRMWMSPAYGMDRDKYFHPKELYYDVMNNVGAVPPISSATGRNPEFVEKLVVPSWEVYCQWQADALHYMIDKKGCEVIFSHLHNVDLIGHQMWHLAKHRDEWNNDEIFYQRMIKEIYEQTDRYLARFLHYLDEEWTIIITSDHGLITEENKTTGLGELSVNGNVMVELGYTALKKDENGEPLHEIDWEHTTAVSRLGGQLYINLKGRDAHGIVDPADKYELEAKIINDLYNYRDPITGQRVVSIALRNKDAIHLGLGGERCGDVIYFMEEGHNIIHADSLSTFKGYFHTSVSPIFVAAGKGIKAGFTTTRTIRQVDVAPTIAALTGLRMPAQCEGAPAYQIFAD